MSTASRVVFESPLFEVGVFSCPPQSPLWNALNLIGSTPHVVFPRTSVVITHAGGRPFVSTRNHVMFYNAGEEYRRALHDRRGDYCVFVSLGPAFAAYGPDRFTFTAGPGDAHAYLLQHVAVRALRVSTPEVLAVEEAIVDAVTRSIAVASSFHAARPAAPGARTRQARYELAENAKSWLLDHYATRSTLNDIARALHTSPFHLARVFRAETGFSLHEYRNQLRLRTALDRIESQENLVTIAHDLGFSSHSHFTRSFTQAFGIAPSQLGKRARKDLLRELRRFVPADVRTAP